MKLTGSQLIEKLQALGPDTSEPARIRAAGYVFTRQGQERLNRAGFYKALALAHINTATLAGRPEAKATGYRGRRLSWETSVLTPGHAVIGRRYLDQLDVKPGDRLRIVPEHGALTIEKAQ
jgi:hypothetical protein